MPYVHAHTGTSWGAVLGGWLAAMGAVALLLPAGLAAFNAALMQAQPTTGALVVPADPTLAIPFVVVLFIAYLIGGYFSGRIAGYRTAYHGMLSGAFGVVIAVLIALAAIVAATIVPELGALFAITVEPATLVNLLSMGALLGVVALILGGWVGGLASRGHLHEHAYVPAAAPTTAPPVVTTEPTPTQVEERARVEEHPPVEERPRVFERHPAPAAGLKGGEPEEVVERKVERTEESEAR